MLCQDKIFELKKMVTISGNWNPIAMSCMFLIACGNEMPKSIRNQNAADARVERKDKETQKSNEKNAGRICGSHKESIPVIENHRRYKGETVYDPLGKPSGNWKPTAEELEMTNRQIIVQLNSDCIYEHRINSINGIFKNLDKYWYFYSGTIENEERWINYSFFRPHEDEIESTGENENVWEKYSGKFRGGGERFWDARCNLDTSECRISINSGR